MNQHNIFQCHELNVSVCPGRTIEIGERTTIDELSEEEKKFTCLADVGHKIVKRKQLEADKELTKALENEIKDGIREKIKHANKQREDNQERKNLLRVKAGEYQVITNTSKIRKYDKKARSKVIKMSPEMIESLATRGRTRVEM